jgi:hypothetical protein
VYFAGLAGKYIKVGWTRDPNRRPFDCWSSHGLSPLTAPLLIVSSAGKNVERIVKRAASEFVYVPPGWRHMLPPTPEVFSDPSPVSSLVRCLAQAANASFFPNMFLRLEAA